MTKLRLVFIAVILAAAIGGWNRTHAQSNLEYFPETGHFVMGEFLSFYHRIDNPIEIYGYPITEVFQKSNGLTVQYFEKARFELYPAEPAESRVRLSPLGEFLYVAGQPQVPIGSAAACRAFPPSEYLVCYDFLAFYLANGGVAQFGAPVSNMEMMGDVKVQYFKNARLEWRPGVNGQTWVKVSPLGREFFVEIGEDPDLLKPVTRNDYRLEDIIRLQARAFPLQSVTGRKGTQTVYILINDQRSQPIEGVDVALIVRWPSGEESRFIAATPTNANGITHAIFPVNSTEIGLATVSIEGVYNRIQIKTQTSFRIWW